MKKAKTRDGSIQRNKRSSSPSQLELMNRLFAISKRHNRNSGAVSWRGTWTALPQKMLCRRSIGLGHDSELLGGSDPRRGSR